MAAAVVAKGIGQPGNQSPWDCPRCLALPHRPCTYVSGGGIHLAVTGDPPARRYVDNVPGEPMTRMHRERPAIRCIPVGTSWTVPR